jgi:hypothetical protein
VILEKFSMRTAMTTPTWPPGQDSVAVTCYEENLNGLYFLEIVLDAD